MPRVTFLRWLAIGAPIGECELCLHCCCCCGFCEAAVDTWSGWFEGLAGETAMLLKVRHGCCVLGKLIARPLTNVEATEAHDRARAVVAAGGCMFKVLGVTCATCSGGRYRVLGEKHVLKSTGAQKMNLLCVNVIYSQVAAQVFLLSNLNLSDRILDQKKRNT